MQKRSWRQTLVGVRGALVLLVVPALALTLFSPRVLQSVETGRRARGLARGRNAPGRTFAVDAGPRRLAGHRFHGRGGV